MIIQDAKSQAISERYIPQPYVPSSPELYNTVKELDSIYFDTYNTCKLEKMDSLTSEDLEFYHDKTLTKGSIEVYSIPGYGAVEVGYHRFRNINEKAIQLNSLSFGDLKTNAGN